MQQYRSVLWVFEYQPFSLESNIRHEYFRLFSVFRSKSVTIKLPPWILKWAGLEKPLTRGLIADLQICKFLPVQQKIWIGSIIAWLFGCLGVCTQRFSNITFPGLDHTRPDQTRPDRTIPDQTIPDQTRPDQTRQDQTRPNQTRPDQTRLFSQFFFYLKTCFNNKREQSSR